MARPRKFDERDVIAAARDVFWTQGYAATTIDDLGAATGLGRGSLYNAFGDKHAVFLRGLGQYCAEAIEEIRTELRDTDLPARDRLATHVHAFAASVASDTDRRGCLVAKSAAELSASDPDVVKLTKRTLDTWRRELFATISEAQRDGDIPGDADPESLASMLLAVLHGIQALRQGGMSAATATAAAEQAIALLFGTAK
jgi:TetR/AcrR family transcriptional regulator, transcriptional repressor for nem operon